MNKLIIIGRVGNDPELKTFDNGGSICNFSVATTERWKDKTTGEKKEATEWHRVRVSGKMAEVCNQYVKKGMMIMCEGALKSREYESNGQKNRAYELHATEVEFLSKAENAQPQPQQPQQTQPEDDLPF